MTKKINLKISNKSLLLALTLLVVVVLAVGINAYNPSLSGGTPSVFGHSIDEIQGACATTGTGCDFLSDYYTKAEVDSLCADAGGSETVPEKPFNFFAESLDALDCDPTCTVALSWIDNSTNEDRFELERKYSGENYEHITNTGPNVESYTDEASEVGDTKYRISACNEYGCSPTVEMIVAY